MNSKDIVSGIIERIKGSKKYSGIYDKTIERIVVGFTIKNDKTDIIEKKSKNLLHQIWGAFYAGKPNFSKLLDNLRKDIVAGKPIKDSVLPILRLQSSVKERIPILDYFYQRIFEITGIPESIADYACGLNPLTLPWMQLPESTEYRAYDIDQQEIDFLRSALDIVKIAHTTIGLGDVLIDMPKYADVVLLLKLLPCLEHQQKGSGLSVLKKIPCKYVVVSFPVKSLGGKKSGMVDFYRNNFKSMIEKERWHVMELLFETELVFVVKK